MDNAHLALLVVVITEDLASTCDEYFLLGQPLSPVPPLPDSVRQNDTESERVDEEDVFAGTLGDQPLR
jgi:hypothetical protein